MAGVYYESKHKLLLFTEEGRKVVKLHRPLIVVHKTENTIGLIEPYLASCGFGWIYKGKETTLKLVPGLNLRWACTNCGHINNELTAKQFAALHKSCRKGISGAVSVEKRLGHMLNEKEAERYISCVESMDLLTEIYGNKKAGVLILAALKKGMRVVIHITHKEPLCIDTNKQRHNFLPMC